MSVRSINPATEETLDAFDPFTDAEIETAIDRSARRFKTWRLEPYKERARLLNAAADILEDRKLDYGEAMTREMGKPIAQAIGEVEKCAWVCRHYAERGADYLADQKIKTDASEAFVRHLPLGPALAIMPWNFPFWQVFRFAAPALMAGNTGLLKHASNVWRSALNIEEVFREAGFPDGCFQTLLIGSGEVETVLSDVRVKAATLTGSGPAGSAVGATAGKQIKPSLLELGGTDAYIVMPSADIETAVETCLKARVQNNGQSCIAAKRFFVHQDVYEGFRDRFVEKMDALIIGDPMSKDTDIGPLSMKQGMDDLNDQVSKSIAAGARRLTKPRDLPARGWYVEPAILEEPPKGSPAADEEMFGPVASLWKVATLTEAVDRANESEFGLGSAIFSNDDSEIASAIRDLEAGATFVNSMVASDPRLPFGGIKQSGYGRELAEDGIKAFVNRKTVSIA